MTKILVVTSSIIERGGKFLLVQEGHRWAYGLWNLPGGKLEDNISLAENVIKEVKEETGFRVSVKGLFGVYQTNRGEQGELNVVKFVLACKIIGGKMLRKLPPDEILTARWFSYPEIKKMKSKLRHKSVLDAIINYRKNGFVPQKSTGVYYDES